MSENGSLNWTNDTRRLGDLIPWEHNPRQIKEAEAERLLDSLEAFGQVQTIAIGPNNEIYDGHQRKYVWAAAAKYGPGFAVDVRVASRPLTERERQQLVVYLHKGAHGEWDWDALANTFEMDDLLEWGFEETELGFDLEPELQFPEDGSGPPKMELLPNEKYDYVLLTFINESAFEEAQSVLGLEQRRDPRSGWAQHVGLCRVIDGTAVIERLRNAGSDSEQGPE